MQSFSKDRWRHQESSSQDENGYVPNGPSIVNPQSPSNPDYTNGNTRPLVYGGKHLVTGANGNSTLQEHTTPVANGYVNGSHTSENNQRIGNINILCGPLLNYKGMSNANSANAIWHGTVLVVTAPRQIQPKLRLRYGHAVNATDGRRQEFSSKTSPVSSGSEVLGIQLYEDPVKTFWRFNIDIPLREHEATCQYWVDDAQSTSPDSLQDDSVRSFVVPASSQSMRVMFHSCNGFSVGTDEDAWSGPALWNDVLRSHEQKPFHVMIGGGDQIYNDSVRVKGPLKGWTDIANPRKRREYPFDERLRAACDAFYYSNYVEWYSAKPFSDANGRIPQVNIWDDHDIIDGFGSYTDHFMKCPVFRGIGGVSFKYYCLFQHHISPPESTFTTSTPQTMEAGPNGAGADPAQLKETYVRTGTAEDSSFILGKRPGPYIPARSRSLYMRLGARIGFLGIDARMERTRHQVNYPETYDTIFERVRSELASAGNKEITHLLVLLGVPIAYPRLIWLENIFTSPIIGPIRFLSKRFGVAGGLFNHFDGQVDLLDDLDDHYTARQHKGERKDLMLRLQALAQEHDVRITILGGDVHLGAVGRFYSKPKHGVPIEQDHRYMTNIISSAITNKPPPQAVANLLARRNKIHHLDHHTDETLMKLFDKDPGNSSKTANFNKVTMPSRNYAIISETDAPNVASEARNTNGRAVNGDSAVSEIAPKLTGKSNAGHRPLHLGEEKAGTKHSAAREADGAVFAGGLDVCLRVEIDQHDREGKTEGYGFSIPPLNMQKAA